MISRSAIRSAALTLAQDLGPAASGAAVPLLTSAGDYDVIILQALRLFAKDRPNVRVVEHTAIASGFRFALSGGSALAALAGVDAWTPGASVLRAVYLPWDVTAQAAAALDGNAYRITLDPGPVEVLELLDRSAAIGDVLRLEFTGQHQLTEAPNTVAAPTAAPTPVLASSRGAGNVTAGTHVYAYTYVTAQGETSPSPAAAAVTVANPAVAGQVGVTVAASADPGVTAVRLYRTVANTDAGTRKLVGSFPVGAPASTGVLCVDNVADGSLGAAAPSTNTAGGLNTVNDGDAEALALLTASLILQACAARMAQNTGNSSFPTDVVDRRSQSDIFRSRAKEYRELYAGIIGGAGAGGSVAAASGFRDLDIPDRFGIGRLWLTTEVR